MFTAHRINTSIPKAIVNNDDDDEEESKHRYAGIKPVKQQLYRGTRAPTSGMSPIKTDNASFHIPSRNSNKTIKKADVIREL